MDADQLHRIMPSLPEARARELAAPLAEAMAEGGLTTTARVAAFVGQVAVESAELRRWEESLSYSAQRLAAVWPGRFRGRDGKPNARAHELAGHPEAVANAVYSHRMGNGPPEDGDGWRYRGRGPIQITGRENYRHAGAALGLPLEEHPELLAQVRPGLRSAVWYWTSRGLSELADTGDYAEITRRIQGGSRELERRIQYTRRALDVLG